jgi:leader peptidase (prepilin peptidase)/N-methyltransferase
VTVATLTLVGVLGLLIGSFLNVCISRLPAGESVVVPPSRCPACRAPIHWYDNLPIGSYLVLGGRCRACQAPISLRYPIVELSTAAAFVWQAVMVGPDPTQLASRLVLTALLVALFGTDLETQRLPNALTLPGTVVGLSFSFWLSPGIQASAIGLALGGGTLLAIRWLWFRLTGVEAMGLGDATMLAMVGAFLGWRQVVVVLFFASVAGAIVGVALTLLSGWSRRSKLPFGTFLALSAFIASLYGERLTDWYLRWYP